MSLRIGIVTFTDDLHAKAVRRAILQKCSSAAVHIFEVDKLATFPGTISIHGRSSKASILDSDSTEIDLNALDAVWWRRSSFPQASTIDDLYSDESQLINRDSQAFIEGLFLVAFVGEWVNHPWAARRSENKIYQLHNAVRAGLSIPNTIFSNDASRIAGVAIGSTAHVVKTIAGLPGKSLLTQKLTPAHADEKVSVTASPACYQQYVEGDSHLRILVAGERYAAANIESTQVDSRSDAASVTTRTEVESSLLQRLRNYLIQLDLSMGIFDMKIDRAGEPHFLEINQQGQFLYLDAIASCNFVQTIAAHLIDVAKKPNPAFERDCAQARSPSI